MKIQDIVGKNLLSVTIAEDETYRFQFEGDELLFIKATGIFDETGGEFDAADLDGKGVREVDYEDEELMITFVDDTVAYISTTDVKDRFGLGVELEDPEAGADSTDVDEDEQDDELED